MFIENKEAIRNSVEYGFDSAFDFKELPIEDYTVKQLTEDIKTAIKEGIIHYINSNK